MAETPIIISIDGPASSGKSTVGYLLAQKLGFLFFDTGILYRAVTCVALQQGYPITHESAITQLASELKIDVLPPTVADGRQNTVLINDMDETWNLRAPAVELNVSIVATYRQVRQLLTNTMRQIGQRGNIVMVGRDIGTVVMPNADVKFFVTSSAEERANRRHQQNLRNHIPSDYAEILAGLKERDHLDSTRATAPLVQAEAAILVDSTHMTIQETVQVLIDLVYLASQRLMAQRIQASQ
jgi:cytidylate kinase